MPWPAYSLLRVIQVAVQSLPALSTEPRLVPAHPHCALALTKCVKRSQGAITACLVSGRTRIRINNQPPLARQFAPRLVSGNVGRGLDVCVKSAALPFAHCLLNEIASGRKSVTTAIVARQFGRCQLLLRTGNRKSVIAVVVTHCLYLQLCGRAQTRNGAQMLPTLCA